MTPTTNPIPRKRQRVRFALAAVLGLSNIALLLVTPFVFFLAAALIVYILSLIVGFLLGSHRAKKESEKVGKNRTMGSLVVLAAAIAIASIIMVLQANNPSSFEASPALMLLAIVWGGTSSFLAGTLIRKAVSVTTLAGPTLPPKV